MTLTEIGIAQKVIAELSAIAGDMKNEGNKAGIIYTNLRVTSLYLSDVQSHLKDDPREAMRQTIRMLDC